MNDLYYHFLSSRNAIHDLERKMIKVSLIDALNDPFELMPYLRRGKEDRKRLNDIRSKLSKKYGLLCFSKTWNEPLLWGLYADKHKGIALGFEISESEYEILKVDYKPGRIKLKLTDDINLNEKKFLKTLSKVKYQEWEHEKEYRILVDLENCVKIDGHYFVKFERGLSVKEIVFGCNYDNSEEYVLKLANQIKSRVIPGRMALGGYNIILNGSKNSKLQQIISSNNFSK